MIRVNVAGPHPCWIKFKDDNGLEFTIRHTDLLAFEHAVAEAKQQVLCRLDRRDWHEVDPKLAQS